MSAINTPPASVDADRGKVASDRRGSIPCRAVDVRRAAAELVDGVKPWRRVRIVKQRRVPREDDLTTPIAGLSCQLSDGGDRL